MSDSEKEQEELNQYLTFILDGEEYGVPILTVRGIQGWEKTTPIPNSPDYVMGIINLRGEVVPIVDLRKRFSLETIPYGAHTVVIVVKIGQADKQRTVGLVVDAVADVHDIDNEDIRKTPEFGEQINNDFVKGLGLIDEKMVIILEIDELVDWQQVPGGNAELDAVDTIPISTGAPSTDESLATTEAA
jgi:purine-binding chemotaxis protein CheW